MAWQWPVWDADQILELTIYASQLTGELRVDLCDFFLGGGGVGVGVGVWGLYYHIIRRSDCVYLYI